MTKPLTVAQVGGFLMWPDVKANLFCLLLFFFGGLLARFLCATL